MKAVRELGADCRETGRSLSAVGVGNLRRVSPSTRGFGPRRASPSVGGLGRPGTSSRSVSSREENRASRRRYAEGQPRERLDGLAAKATSGEGVKASSWREEGEPGGGEAQEGIGPRSRLNTVGAATDPGEEEALKARRRFVALVGQPAGSGLASTT